MGLALGLLEHLPKAVGILLQGLAFCVVGAMADIALGGRLSVALLKLLGL